MSRFVADPRVLKREWHWCSAEKKRGKRQAFCIRCCLQLEDITLYSRQQKHHESYRKSTRSAAPSTAYSMTQCYDTFLLRLFCGCTRWEHEGMSSCKRRQKVPEQSESSFRSSECGTSHWLGTVSEDCLLHRLLLYNYCGGSEEEPRAPGKIFRKSENSVILVTLTVVSFPMNFLIVWVTIISTVEVLNRTWKCKIHHFYVWTLTFDGPVLFKNVGFWTPE